MAQLSEDFLRVLRESYFNFDIDSSELETNIALWIVGAGSSSDETYIICKEPLKESFDCVIDIDLDEDGIMKLERIRRKFLKFIKNIDDKLDDKLEE